MDRDLFHLSAQLLYHSLYELTCSTCVVYAIVPLIVKATSLNCSTRLLNQPQKVQALTALHSGLAYGISLNPQNAPDLVGNMYYLYD